VAGVLTGGTPREELAAAGATHVLASVTELPALVAP
jgi:phosphoglycolate phosphatase